MREKIGIALFAIGALGAGIAFLAPNALWDYLDPEPGGRVPLMVLFSSCALAVVGLLVGLSRQATRMFP